MRAIELLFWGTAAALAYVYFGYPVLVFLGSRFRSRRVCKGETEPTISIIVAAHNECAHIGHTIENKLSLNYPGTKIQIIVVSDGSTDGTDEIVGRYLSRGIVRLRQEPRNGKTAALNLAVRHATGEVLVFADANSMYDADAVQHLVRNFADPGVGYVTGRLVYQNANGSMTGDGCSLYMKYENFIRTCESGVGSLVGVNGGIDAVRSALYEPMDADDLPDLVLPLRVVAQGYRVVYESSALLSETANVNARDEYRMRVRVSLRALWTLAEMRSLFNIRHYGIYALQLLSHKLLRYMAFVFVVTMFAATVVLWPVSSLYRIALLLQLACLLMAYGGFLAERRRRPAPLLSIPFYFLLANAAAAQAFVKFLKGERHRVWKPRLG